ncbi:MAG: GAF domain-containing protein, partial [Candidatus Dormibacteraceae bacterium]
MSSLDPANPQAFGQDIISAVANQLAAELANSPVDSRAIARGAVKMLSRLVPGTWVAVIMNDDPTTSHVVAADERAPAMAAYMDRYVADLYAAGQATTTGLSQHVIDSGEHVLMPTLPLADFILLATPAGQEYLARHPYPVPIESVGLLIAPMRSLGATIGTLGVFQYNTATALSETDVGWLQKVADRVGIAIDHAQLRAPAIERQERLAAITN